MIKSPKLYFIDVGLVCHLLGISTTEHLALHPLRGMLFENMVVMDFIKNQINRGNRPQVYFYRDNNQNEVDLIFEQAGKLMPIEIKSSETFNRRFLNGVEYFMKLTPKAETGYLIYAGNPVGGSDKIKILNYKHTGDILDS